MWAEKVDIEQQMKTDENRFRLLGSLAHQGGTNDFPVMCVMLKRQKPYF